MTSGGELLQLPQPETPEKRRNVPLLLQENRAYTGGQAANTERRNLLSER